MPAYRFQCSGRVTEWRACVQPGGSSSEQYYIQFQVWRPTGIEVCYELVGFNTPLDDARVEGRGFLSPPGEDTDQPWQGVVTTSVTCAATSCTYHYKGNGVTTQAQFLIHLIPGKS